MKISLIVAASTNNVIGIEGNLPWHLTEDLKKFKATTMGKPMIMGRATYESIGRPLPGRRSIVLSRQHDFSANGCEVVSSVEEALARAGDVDEVMVIGGGKIYEQFLPMASFIYFTRVNVDVSGDTFFPALIQDEWQRVQAECFAASDALAIGYSFELWQRIK